MFNYKTTSLKPKLLGQKIPTQIRDLFKEYKRVCIKGPVNWIYQIDYTLTQLPMLIYIGILLTNNLRLGETI